MKQFVAKGSRQVDPQLDVKENVYYVIEAALDLCMRMLFDEGIDFRVIDQTFDKLETRYKRLIK